MMDYVITVLLSAALMLVSLHAMAAEVEGEALFNEKCACCHYNQDALRLSESKIKKALTGDIVRAHYFKLTDAELKQITNYLSGK